MSNYKDNNSKSNLNNNDIDSCDDIYSELPKEVVDMLKKTHPLMAKEANSKSDDATNSQSEEFSRIPSLPSSRGDDVSEVREARMQKVGDELEEIKNYPPMEGDPTKFATRRDVNEVLEGINVVLRTPKEVKKMNGEDDQERPKDINDDGIEFVSVVPARNKFNDRDAVSYPTSRVNGQTADGQGTSKKKRKMQGDNNMKNQKVPYDDIDFEEREKQEQLDNLYDDGYYEDDVMFSGREKTFTIAFGVGIVAILFLSFRLASLSTALEKAEMDLANSLEMNTKYEELQLQNMNLQERLDALLPSDGSFVENSSVDGADGSVPFEAGEEGDLGTITVYTVVEGDNGWSIAQKVYGNGSRFTEILEANGLKESDTIRVGMKLNIPR